MSKDTIVAKRYAKALFAAARERDQVAEVEQDLVQVVELVWAQDDFRKIVEHPNIETKAKLSFLQAALEGKIAELAYRTILLLVERRRENMLPALLRYYSEIADAALGRAKAVVTSPKPLSDGEVAKLQAAFSTITGKNIVIETLVDQSLLGGLRVRIGNRLYDGSLSTRLTDLQKTLAM